MSKEHLLLGPCQFYTFFHWIFCLCLFQKKKGGNWISLCPLPSHFTKHCMLCLTICQERGITCTWLSSHTNNTVVLTLKSVLQHLLACEVPHGYSPLFYFVSTLIAFFFKTVHFQFYWFFVLSILCGQTIDVILCVFFFFFIFLQCVV